MTLTLDFFSVAVPMGWNTYNNDNAFWYIAVLQIVLIGSFLQFVKLLQQMFLKNIE